MKGLKKILSSFLIVSILFSMSAVMVSANYLEGETENIYKTEVLGLLNALEIVDWNEGELNQSVLRGEFSKLACKIGGYEQTVDESVIFSDVANDNEYAGYIKTLVNIGAVTGDVNGMFLPDGEITLLESTAILVKILGYSIQAEARGGWPNGYYSIAKRIGLFDGIDLKLETAATRGMIAKLLSNALEADITIHTKYGNDLSFEYGKATNLLNTIFKINHIKGVIDGVDLSRVMGVNDLNPFYISVGGMELEASQIYDIHTYLGYMSDVYYTIEPHKISRVKYIKKAQDNKSFTIKAENITDADNGKIRFWDEKTGEAKEKNYKIGIPVIYNGVSTREAFSKSLIENKNGEVVLLDNNDDNVFDIIFVDVYENYVISYVDKNKKIVYDEYDNLNNVSLDNTKNDPYVIIYDENKEEISPSKLKTKTVISVFESAADSYQKYIRAYVSSTVKSGKIEKIKDNEEIIVIGNKDYKLSKRCKTKNTLLYTPGMDVKLYLDISGEVAYIEKNSPQANFGFIMDGQLKSNMSSTIELKMFTQNGEFVIYGTEKKFKIDSVVYKNDENAAFIRLNKAAQQIYGSTIPANCYASLVSYTLNDDGKITSIDTVLKSEKVLGDFVAADRETTVQDGDALFSVKAGDGTYPYYLVSRGTCGSLVALNKEGVFIMYPQDVDDIMDEEQYFAGKPDDVLANYTPCSDLRAFYTDSSQLKAPCVLYPYSESAFGNFTDEASFAVVSETYTVMGKDGNPLDAASTWTASGLSEIVAQPGTTFDVNNDSQITLNMKITDLKCGDLIMYNTDKNGYVKHIDLYYRAENDSIVSNLGDNTAYANRSICRGFVYDKLDEGYMIYITSTEQVAALAGKTSKDCHVVPDTSREAIYYAYRKKPNGEAYVEEASKSDLKAYKDTGEGCSKILIQRFSGEARAILIIE